VPCPSSKEGPSSESTLPFLAFSSTTRSAVRSFLSAQWPPGVPCPNSTSRSTGTWLERARLPRGDITSTDGLDTHIHDQILHSADFSPIRLD
jgi:hypothetical protein